MRTLPGEKIREFKATIEFLIWTAGTEYTFHELEQGVIRNVLNEGPWLDNVGKPAWYKLSLVGGTSTTLLYDRTLEDGRKRYNISVEYHGITRSRLNAFANFAVDANQRLRTTPPRECIEICTSLSFEAYLGPYPWDSDMCC